MRRLLAPLLAFAMAAVLAPAAQATNGVLEIVSNGPAEGTLTLPRDMKIDYRRDISLVTRNWYVVLAVTKAGRTTAAFAKLPAYEYREWYRHVDDLPGGTSTVRVLTEGTLKIRVPVTGFAGKRTVRLDRRLRGGSVTIREIVPSGPAREVDDPIEFSAPRSSVLVHGVFQPRAVTAASRRAVCTTSRGSRCGLPDTDVAPLMPWEWSVLHLDWGRYQPQGTAYAYSSDVTDDPQPVTHYVFVLPTA